MFRRILVANRGEVAARITRTAQAMGIEVVAIASSADRDHAWLANADRVVCIGGARASESYLDMDAILEAARVTGCAAVHPGWGFLAENPVFASRCVDAGLTFIGPSAEHLRMFGDKSVARATMARHGMPIIPGTKSALESIDAARAAADDVGYPVLLKAVAGGGGRGMRAVDDPADLAAAFQEATAEAISCFGDGRMYLERRIVGGRHVEVQVLGDGFGNAIHLGERECSLQRRHQKVVEEAPSPGLSPAERARVLPLVASVVAATGYRNAGTVEMLLDDKGSLWFMEMNTRLQVEHPVSEEITGVDIVEQQLRVAANQPLSISQSDVTVQGHALELRLNAEDPTEGFKPCPGVVSELSFPEGEGIRVDTHLRSGDSIPAQYDSMVAKLIISGPNRPAVLARAREALAETRIGGVKTNIGLHGKILEWEPFVSGNYDTTSLERSMTTLVGGN